MNSGLSLTATAANRAILKILMRFFAISLCILISLYIFALAPLYIWFSSDILYMGTALPEIFDILLSAVDVLVFGISYGVLLYTIYRFSLKKAMPYLYVLIGSVLYKNIGNLLMTYITDGFTSENLLTDLLDIGLLILLELLQTAIAVFLAVKVIGSAKNRENIRMEAAREAKKLYTPSVELLPFSRLLNMKNPIQKAAFLMASVPMLVHILQRIYYDIFFFVTEGFYGDPIVDILWMILYYTIDIISYGVIVYFIMILLISRFEKMRSALKSRFEADLAGEDTLPSR